MVRPIQRLRPHGRDDANADPHTDANADADADADADANSHADTHAERLHQLSDLVGDQRYASVCTAFTPQASGGLPVSIAAGSFSRQGSLILAGQTYTFTAANDVRQSFAQADRDASFSAVNGLLFTKPSRTSGRDQLAIERLYPSQIELDYTRSVFFDSEGATDSIGKVRTNAFCATGVPTNAADFPTGAAVTYTRSIVAGRAFDVRGGGARQYDLIGPSNATLVVDPTTGRFTSTLRIIGVPTGGTTGANVDFGTFNLQGTIDITASALAGQATESGPLVLVRGGFFGPQGKEVGITFTRTAVAGDPSGFSFIGVIFAARP